MIIELRECPDIHILLNTIHSPSILNSPASASWIPVCLPKFNPSGFVNAYISFLRKDDEQKAGEASLMTRSSEETQEETPTVNNIRPKPWLPRPEDSGIALICISGGGEFDTIRGWCDTVTQVRAFLPGHSYILTLLPR